MNKQENIRKHIPPNITPVSLLSAGILILCLLVGIPLVLRSQKSDQTATKSGFYFNTIIQITLYGTNNSELIDECFSLASRYENLLSNTIPESEISRINANAGNYVTVSDETLEVLNAGIAYGDMSQGAFDITIGNVSEIWNFSEISSNLNTENNEATPDVLPDENALADAARHVNYKNLLIKDHQVMLSDPKAKLDLGGIAKGYIADKMREYLNSQGITTGIINLGGNVLTLGPKKEDAPYVIGIRKPFSDAGATIGTLKIHDASVVTSGVYERYYRVDGRLYHHILNTDTGYPCDNDLWEVTIISASSMDGDALSTACFALGLREGMELIESLDGVEAVFVTNDERIYTSGGITDTQSAGQADPPLGIIFHRTDTK